MHTAALTQQPEGDFTAGASSGAATHAVSNQRETPLMRRPFQGAFCERFGCPAESFQHSLLRESMDPWLRPLASLVQRVCPSFFHNDLEYLARVGDASTWPEVWSLANYIRSDPCLNRGLLRRGLHLRVSGMRLIQTYARVAEAALTGESRAEGAGQ